MAMPNAHGNLVYSTDNESALKILNKFNDMAYSVLYKDVFTKAAGILYGPSFIIKTDSSIRMYFRCMICNKDMNNIRSLTGHALSGSHLKKIDCNSQDSLSLGISRMNITAAQNPLQMKIINSSVPIVGMNRAEAYNDGGKNWYYKCTLCGVHGNADSVYNHLIGDKHTDRYIRSRLVLKSSTITQEERNYVRTFLISKDDFTVQNIRTIHGQQYYPYIWESDGKLGYSSKSKKIIYGLNDMLSQDANSENGNEACAVLKEENEPEKCCAEQYYRLLILKIKSLYFDLSQKENQFKNCEDVRNGLIILSFLLHWKFYVLNNIVQEEKDVADSKAVKQQKLTIGCLGYVEQRLKPSFRSRYGDRAGFQLD